MDYGKLDGVIVDRFLHIDLHSVIRVAVVLHSSIVDPEFSFVIAILNPVEFYDEVEGCVG